MTMPRQPYAAWFLGFCARYHSRQRFNIARLSSQSA
jgi:hypothetical protein